MLTDMLVNMLDDMIYTKKFAMLLKKFRRKLERL